MAAEAKEMPPESILRHKPQQLSGGMYLKDRAAMQPQRCMGLHKTGKPSTT